jgi:hypothetical protein
MRIRHSLPALILATISAAAAGPVAADCNLAGPPEEVLPTAQIAFVGRAIEVDGPIARFAVSEVWAGHVDPVVEVRGLLDPLDPKADGRQPVDRPAARAQLSEDDRQWEEGGVYRVIPFVDGNVLRDHICTATTEWTDELAALRPASAQVVQVPTPIGPVFIGLAAVAILALSILGFRHPRR